MEEKRFTQDHEWIAKEGETWKIGISSFAQEQLGDVVYISLPEKGATFSKGEAFGVIESVKAASDIYAPVAIEVVESNGSLEENPELVNEDAEGKGWLISVKLKSEDIAVLETLRDAGAYKEEYGT